MARSFRRTPIHGVTTARSEHADKRFANRRLRHRARQALDRGDDVLPVMREVSNVWSFAKDGKFYFGPGGMSCGYWGAARQAKWMRK